MRKVDADTVTKPDGVSWGEMTRVKEYLQFNERWVHLSELARDLVLTEEKAASILRAYKRAGIVV